MLFPVCILDEEGRTVGISPLVPGGLRFNAETINDLRAELASASHTMILGECDDAQRLISEHANAPEYEAGYWITVELGGKANGARIGSPYKLNVSMDTVLHERIKHAAKVANTNVSAWVRDAIKARLPRG